MEDADVRPLVLLDLFKLVVVEDHASLRPALMTVVASGVVMSPARDTGSFVLRPKTIKGSGREDKRTHQCQQAARAHEGRGW